MHSANKLDLAAGHLNAATGPIVEPGHLALALRDGSVAHVEAGGQTAAVHGLLHSLFIEIDPALILSCAREAGTDWKHVNRLYAETLADGMPRVRAWERLVADRT
ncbi:hypothetical protein [Thiomonas sp.]